MRQWIVEDGLAVTFEDACVEGADRHRVAPRTVPPRASPEAIAATVRALRSPTDTLHFDTEVRGATTHVFATEVLGRDGTWVPVESILTTAVTFGAAEETVLQALIRQVMEQLRAQHGKLLSATPGMPAVRLYQREATMPAREALTVIAGRIGPTASWYVGCRPEWRYLEFLAPPTPPVAPIPVRPPPAPGEPWEPDWENDTEVEEIDEDTVGDWDDPSPPPSGPFKR